MIILQLQGAHDDSQRQCGHVVQGRIDPQCLGGRCRLRLPGPRPEDRHPGDPPHAPGRGLGQLGSSSRRRHRRTAPGHRVRQPRCGRFERFDAQEYRGDGQRRGRIYRGAGARQGRPLRLLDGRHDRPGNCQGRTAARSQAHLGWHRSRGRRGHHERDQDLAPRHPSSTVHSPRPQAVPLLHSDAQRASSRQGVLGSPEGAHRQARQAHFARVVRSPTQGHSPLG